MLHSGPLVESFKWVESSSGVEMLLPHTGNSCAGVGGLSGVSSGCRFTLSSPGGAVSRAVERDLAVELAAVLVS